MKELFHQMLSGLQAGEDLVLVTVIASSGSTPRGAGARMLVGKSGRICGTIGGGAVEYEAERIAGAALHSRASSLRSFALTPNQVADLGMICGGAVTIYFQYIPGGDIRAIKLAERALGLLLSGEPAWLVTCLDCGEMGVYDPIQGFRGTLPEEVASSFSEDSKTFEANGRRYYAEQISYAGKVYIFGGGHVAQRLVPVLAHVGFRCVVLDDRREFTAKELFPQAERTILVDFERISDSITITAADYVAVMTRGHQYDTLVQMQVLRTPACYIGVMGSKQKMEAVGKKLMEAGFKQQDIDRIHTPIGLEIKAETPEEISISIAAELVLERAQRETP